MPRIYPAITSEDLKIAKGLFEEYLTCILGLDGHVHAKEVEAHKHQMNNLGEYFRPPEECLLVATHRSEPAGCVALRKLSNDTCEMKRLYVKPRLRGLKIGRDLANAVIEQARKLGYMHMRIHTISALEQANRLYRWLGFNEIDPYEYTPRDDAVFMELKLVQKFGFMIMRFITDKMKEKLDSTLIRKLNSFTDDFLSEQDGILDKKTIELVATAVSICADCSPCTDFHITEAVKHGATSEETNKVFKIVMAVSAGKRKVFSRGLTSDF